MLPPILEIYVVWHPDEHKASSVADAILEHFRGSPFVGLIGGAVEVYTRSAPWGHATTAPRPIPALSAPPNGVAVPRISVVVLLRGPKLNTAASDDPGWAQYLTEIRSAHDERRLRLVIVPLVPGAATGTLAKVVANVQGPGSVANGLDHLCREIGQATAQHIGDALGSAQLQVFVSHTKRASSMERDASTLDELIKVTRQTIGDTHLGQFFDANSIQVGEDFAERIQSEAARSVLLVLRTDLFSSREWCQTEVATAKAAGVPIVVVHAQGEGDPRGSFLLDHVPSIRLSDVKANWITDIQRALNRLVDEALKRALWSHQRADMEQLGFDWLPPHSPEPATLVPWLIEAAPGLSSESLVAVLHPDPPLEPKENELLEGILALSSLKGRVEIFTPRTFASRGGVVKGSDPKLLAQDALSGTCLAISVSESPDLETLGVADAQIQLTVAEIARAVFLAGGVVMYGGRIDGTGFNLPLIHEVQQYAPDRSALHLCVAYPEHRKLSLDQLQETEAQLATFGRVTYLDAAGNECNPKDSRGDDGDPVVDQALVAASYTGLRRYMAEHSSARVLVGGKLEGYLGRMPGLLEEALLSVEAGSPLYIAGGYGGAATLAGQALSPHEFEWSSDTLEAASAPVQQALADLQEAVTRTSWNRLAPGLDTTERLILAATHRAGEIASLVARGLARRGSGG